MAGVAGELLIKQGDLVARRRVLKGELTTLAADIAAIDRVIRMVGSDLPNDEPHSVVPRVTTPFPSGELTPAALEALRKLGPTTSSACAEAMLAARGVDHDRTMVAQVANRVSAIFCQKADSGQVRRAGTCDGRQVIWEIAA